MKDDQRSYVRNFCANILHITQLYDFIILSRVYNEPIQRPAPSWLVSLIGRARHLYRRAQGFELQA